MNGQQKHKIRLRLKLIRFKNEGFLTFTDRLIRFFKPPKKYNGAIKKILIIRSDRIGDAIVTIPVIRDLKLNYPDMQIHVISSNKNRFIFEGSPHIDKLITFGMQSPLRKVFEYDEGYTGKFKLSGFERKILSVFLAGRLIHFLIYFAVPYFFSGQFRNEISSLKKENYDIVFDLKGSKRIALVSGMISKYTAGSRLFLFSWLYTYYTQTNWVGQHDTEQMTIKIENLISECSGLVLVKRNKSMPYINVSSKANEIKRYDIFFHIGTSELRKLSIEQETQLLDSLNGKKVILTDSFESEVFATYKKKFNYTFKLYANLEQCAEDAINCKLIICYDGGQAHYLSQFGKTITIFGPGSVQLWKPYEFEDYEPYAAGDTTILKSKGKFGHMAAYSPMWCSPCFDIGCAAKPCLHRIEVKKITNLIEELLK